MISTAFDRYPDQQGYRCNCFRNNISYEVARSRSFSTRQSASRRSTHENLCCPECAECINRTRRRSSLTATTFADRKYSNIISNGKDNLKNHLQQNVTLRGISKRHNGAIHSALIKPKTATVQTATNVSVVKQFGDNYFEKKHVSEQELNSAPSIKRINHRATEIINAINMQRTSTSLNNSLLNLSANGSRTEYDKRILDRFLSGEYCLKVKHV